MPVLELLLTSLIASMLGYLIKRLEGVEKELFEVKESIIRLEILLPKRKTD